MCSPAVSFRMAVGNSRNSATQQPTRTRQCNGRPPSPRLSRLQTAKPHHERWNYSRPAQTSVMRDQAEAVINRQSIGVQQKNRRVVSLVLDARRSGRGAREPQSTIATYSKGSGCRAEHGDARRQRSRRPLPPSGCRAARPQQHRSGMPSRYNAPRKPRWRLMGRPSWSCCSISSRRAGRIARRAERVASAHSARGNRCGRAKTRGRRGQPRQ